jgi:hypothetical protein
LNATRLSRIDRTERISELSSDRLLPESIRKPTRLARPGWVTAVPLIATMAAFGAACGGSMPAPENETGQPGATDVESTPSFLAVSRPDTSTSASADRMRKTMGPMPADALNPSSAFYLAIHRRELEGRWFLSGYLKQISVGGPNALAASSLGTRVVSFRIQNGKLFVFDADERRAWSDNFVDEQIVDAYPLVDVRDLSPADARCLQNYVVVDPAAGLNRFGIVGDAYADGQLGVDAFRVELAFSQKFRALEDGATFEQVFTGYGIRPHASVDDVDSNPFRASGVLGLSLRRYTEGAGFEPLPMPTRSHYFATPPHRVPNAGITQKLALKWNLRPDLPPIEWEISPRVLEAAKRPALVALGVDLFGAVKTGIESWNTAFGFEALRAKLGTDADAFAEDDRNVLIWDVNPQVGGAFADFRPNPNTGEIRGASVYFNDFFVDVGLATFAPSDTGVAAPVAAKPASKTARVVWRPMPGRSLCDLKANPALEARRMLALDQSGASDSKAQIEKWISLIVAHEIGHTLGLRHNFKGSLMPPSSSVMDYIDQTTSVAAAMPGAYDVAAIRHLYGLAPTLPSQLFCTDDDVGTDPSCEVWDAGADPLREHWAPLHQALGRAYLETEAPVYSFLLTALTVPQLAKFVQRAAKPADRTAAFQIALDSAAVPADESLKETFPESYPRYANGLLSTVLDNLVPNPATLVPPYPGGPVPVVPPLDGATSDLMFRQLRGVVFNEDGLRDFPARRLSIDTLKWMQTQPAYATLREVRTTMVTMNQTTGTTHTTDEQAQRDDLLARIERALSPYFD